MRLYGVATTMNNSNERVAREMVNRVSGDMLEKLTSVSKVERRLLETRKRLCMQYRTPMKKRVFRD